MDVNKGRFEEIFPVVTTVYKSTSPIGFCGGSDGASPPLSVNLIHFRDSSYLSFLADSGAFVLKVSLSVFL